MQASRDADDVMGSLSWLLMTPDSSLSVASLGGWYSNVKRYVRISVIFK